MKTQQNSNPPQPFNMQHTQTLHVPPCPGLVVCSPSNSKRMGHWENQCQKTGAVVWEIKCWVSVTDICCEVIPLGSHCVHGVSPNTHDSIFLHFVGMAQMRRLSSGMGWEAPYAIVPPNAGFWEVVVPASSLRLPGKVVQNRKQSSGFSESRCWIPFPILVSPLWSSSVGEPTCGTVAGQWV